jgi:hypothetical protein
VGLLFRRDPVKGGRSIALPVVDTLTRAHGVENPRCGDFQTGYVDEMLMAIEPAIFIGVLFPTTFALG